jgi:site-specific recombinase XerD
MRKFNAENERIKRRYEQYLREAKGQDDKSVDKVRAALVKFEDCTKFKAFRSFHIDQARQFKDALRRAKNANGKPLSLTTTDATLRLVKGFFHWLAGQQGYKRVLSYSDVEYFNNNRNDARAAHAQRPVQYPSTQATYHAFQAMSDRTELERRDKAMFGIDFTGHRIEHELAIRHPPFRLREQGVLLPEHLVIAQIGHPIGKTRQIVGMHREKPRRDRLAALGAHVTPILKREPVHQIDMFKAQ